MPDEIQAEGDSNNEKAKSYGFADLHAAFLIAMPEWAANLCPALRLELQILY
ncbi:hypothetical protein [Mesorhizobium sp.]|uniref:hypothetical protein n=1 Tax=Mesorhizobium sp. TaxID=1871066 RepID=UPI0025F8A0AF|nr:hypothetical protein [Mesorhizobium sp.]